eukprot:750119-Prymnesium_polylepis.1
MGWDWSRAPVQCITWCAGPTRTFRRRCSRYCCRDGRSRGRFRSEERCEAASEPPPLRDRDVPELYQSSQS